MQFPASRQPTKPRVMGRESCRARWPVQAVVRALIRREPIRDGTPSATKAAGRTRGPPGRLGGHQDHRFQAAGHGLSAASACGCRRLWAMPLAGCRAPCPGAVGPATVHGERATRFSVRPAAPCARHPVPDHEPGTGSGINVPASYRVSTAHSAERNHNVAGREVPRPGPWLRRHLRHRTSATARSGHSPKFTASGLLPHKGTEQSLRPGNMLQAGSTRSMEGRWKAGTAYVDRLRGLLVSDTGHLTTVRVDASVQGWN